MPDRALSRAACAQIGCDGNRLAASSLNLGSRLREPSALLSTSVAAPTEPSLTAAARQAGGAPWPGSLSSKPRAAGRQGEVQAPTVCRLVGLVPFTTCAIVGWTAWRSRPGGRPGDHGLADALVAFLIPYGMLVAELGSAFPVEGSPCEWVRPTSGTPATYPNGPVFTDDVYSERFA
jgi:hypothetical protein